MQGYDIEAALPFIAKAMRKEGVKASAQELEAFIRRAMEADFAYMQENGLLTEDGLMGEDEYDEDDAFEVILDMLVQETGIDEEDDDAMGRLAQMLDAFMSAQEAFMDSCGLME